MVSFDLTSHFKQCDYCNEYKPDVFLYYITDQGGNLITESISLQCSECLRFGISEPYRPEEEQDHCYLDYPEYEDEDE